MEFLPQDYESMTVGTTFRRISFFAWSIAVVRMVMRKELTTATQNKPHADHDQKRGHAGRDDDEIVGVLTQTDKHCKRRILAGEDEVLKTFETEQDRLDTLREWFGIIFRDVERSGVLMTVVHLPH